jgi:hypothetical protein
MIEFSNADRFAMALTGAYNGSAKTGNQIQLLLKIGAQGDFIWL